MEAATKKRRGRPTRFGPEAAAAAVQKPGRHQLKGSRADPEKDKNRKTGLTCLIAIIFNSAIRK